MKFGTVSLTLSLFVLDRLLKYLVIVSPQPLWGDFFLLHVNPGIAFSLPLPLAILSPMLVGGLIVVIWLFIQEVKTRSRKFVPLLFILAGALSNIVDRIWMGGVIDYFAVPVLGFYFNIADGMIVSGIALLLLKGYGKLKR